MLVLQVGFAHPGVAATVMVYLASDGSWSGEQCRRTVTILLSDTTGRNHSLGMFSYDVFDCIGFFKNESSQILSDTEMLKDYFEYLPRHT